MANMKELIKQNKTSGGGWTRSFLKSIGVPWPPPKGWRTKLEETDAEVKCIPMICIKCGNWFEVVDHKPIGSIQCPSCRKLTPIIRDEKQMMREYQRFLNRSL